MRACAAHQLHGTEQRLPVARRRRGWRRRSPPRSWRRSPRPGSRASAGAIGELERPARAAARRSAARGRARRVRGRARAAPVRRVRAREPARRPHPRARARGRARRASSASDASSPRSSTRRPEPLTDAERASARPARARPPAAVGGRHDHRPRPQGAAAHADQRGRSSRSTHEPRRAEVEIVWEGGARTELTVPLIARGPERHRTSEDTIELIRRLAEHTPTTADRRDPQQARPPHRHRAAVQPAARRVHARQRTGSPPRRHPTPTATCSPIEQAADRARRRRRHDPPMAQRRAAPRRADHPARAVADPAHRRGPRPVRARRPRRLPAARSRPRSGSGAPARPCCTRSNAASCTPSKSPAAGEKA